MLWQRERAQARMDSLRRHVSHSPVGKPGDEMIVHRKNGYLYLDHIRLITELEPGLFFASDGEAVDFRGNEPAWRNIRLHRV